MNNRMNRVLGKKLNKKGIFYSLTVIMFLIFLLIVFSNRADIQKRKDEFHVQRSQIIVMDHFVRDFDRYYAGAIIETAAKPALIDMTPNVPPVFSKADVVNAMTNTIPLVLRTGENFNQALGTLTFKLNNRDFSYSLESVEQLTYDTIRLNFLVNYSFNMFNTNWSKHNKPVSIKASVHGLYHPTHSPVYNSLIDDSWVEDTYATGCFVDEIFSAGSVCSGADNIRPQIVCGNNILEPGEECDPPNGVDCDDNCQDIIIVVP